MWTMDWVIIYHYAFFSLVATCITHVPQLFSQCLCPEGSHASIGFSGSSICLILEAGIQDFEANWEGSMHGIGMPSP